MELDENNILLNRGTYSFSRSKYSLCNAFFILMMQRRLRARNEKQFDK